MPSSYRNRTVAGRGAYGTVYEVRNKQTGALGAVKSIPKAKLMNDADVSDV